MKLYHKQVAEFQQMIFSWWESNKRDLPWRQTSDPYKILVSELMLQQTQVSRVIEKYQTFLQTFPTLSHLAGASLGAVIIAWKGLGYNRRAKYLHQTASVIVNHYGGVFPQDEKVLLSLPGIGSYTARALLVFAYRQDIVMVDTNIRKIITAYFFDGNQPKEQMIIAVANELLPTSKAWEWHQALMDFGAIELPKVLKQKGWYIPVPKQSRFVGSRRYFRGKILDVLRKQQIIEGELIQLLINTYNADGTTASGCLEDLIREGLIRKLPSERISLV